MSFTRIPFLALVFAALSGLGHSAHGGGLPEVRVVPSVDLDRYVGKWYEIASFPQRFQRGCTATTATYSLREDGEIDVLNECRKGGFDGEQSRAKGRAWVVDPKEPAKLRVRFFWPFSGAYWIIDLGKDYEYAVVGHPDRDNLWILSRTPALDSETYQGILKRIEEQGFDLSRLQRTRQPGGWTGDAAGEAVGGDR